jgi:hypothetical protein
MEISCVVQTPTPNLGESQAFYRRLGFSQLDEAGLLWTDGKAIIEINPDRYARAAIKLTKKDWHFQIELLAQITKVISTDFGFLLADPSGTWILLVDESPSLVFEPKEETFSVLGNFHGLSLETMDLDKSIAIFEILGFVESGGSKDHGYVGFSLGGFSVSLMKPLCCPHLFFNPSLNYFNGQNNLAIIASLRNLGMHLTEEITYFNKEGLVDNVIIRDPGGIGFFIFSD